MKKNSVWKKIILVLLPLAAMGILAALDPNVVEFGDVLEAISPLWLLAAVGSMLAYYVLDAVMYLLACRYMQVPQRFGEGLLTTMVGFFYSALTPFSSGGQPMQVMQMRRRGIPVGTSTSVMILKFLAWQLAITLMGICGFVFLREDVLASQISVLVMYILGFCFFLGSVVVAALALLRPGWMYAAGEKLLRLLERLRILRNEERIARVHATWKNTIADYGGAMRFALQHKGGMLLIFLVAVLEAVSYMAVTYFIYRGLGFDARGVAYVILLQGLLYISVSFVPLPGASIASEGGFYLVFAKLFSAGARFPAMLLWRLITYYSALGLGFVAVLIDGLRNPAQPPAAKEDGAAAHTHAPPAMPPLQLPQKKKKSAAGS